MVHFLSKTGMPALVKEWSEAARYAPLESCARQVWAGTKHTFSDFPRLQADTFFRHLNGVEGYTYLLEMMTGLNSPRIGEDHIVHQYTEKWAKFQRRQPDLASTLSPLWEALQRDNLAIRKAVVSNLIPPTDDHVIRIMSGLIKNDDVMIIADTMEDMKPSSLARTAIKALGNNRNGRPLVNSITIVSPDQNDADAILTWMKESQNRRYLHKDISLRARPIEDISAAVEQAARVYMTLPVGRYPEIDRSVAQAWKDRVRQDSSFSHLDEASHLNGTIWANAGLDKFIMPGSLQRFYEGLQSYNAHVVALAKEAIEYCAHCRLSDERPEREAFTGLIQTTLRPRALI